jgi:hypothetical protein
VSLRERLEGKAARTTVVQIPVGDPPPDLRRRAREQAERAELASYAATLKEGHVTPEVAGDFADEAETTIAELAEFYEPVELRAVSAPDWDALLTQYTKDTKGESELDTYAALPAMLALCCTDEGLQDADWWSEQFTRPGWTFGDREALLSALLRLNAYAPLPQLGKGSRTTH